MTSAVAELDTILQSMLNLKPPGVSGSKITSITSLCTANIQSESAIIQKIYTHFRKTPPDHKLGVLYVVDSVSRQWVDQAKKAGQALGGGASDGTFAAGVARVTELLPSFINEILNTAPEDQKVKIKKLLEIWERSNTFPATMLASFKEKLNAPPASSTTPVGSPVPGFTPLGQATNGQAPAPASQDTSAILEALKNMHKQNTASQPSTASAAPPSSLSNLLGNQFGGASASTVNQGLPTTSAQAVNPLGAMFPGMSNGTASQNIANAPPNQNALAAFLGQHQAQAQAHAAAPQTVAPVSAEAQLQFQLIQTLAQNNVPPEQWATALQLLNAQKASGDSGNAGAPAQSSQWGGAASRDRGAAQTRSPPGFGRRRSRSPGSDRRRGASSDRGRGSPAGNPFRDDRRGGGDYRQRSPQGRRRRTPTPPRNEPNLPPPGPRNIQYDRSLPPGHIMVLSRTLFVGGVTQREAQLRDMFAQFGIVQTCIVNIDKRHAFIKMLTRKDAERARNGMEDFRDGSSQLRTKWGVGFGPRDCSDYQTGVSKIPIERLTDADRKWMVTAEYGGTGGQPLEPGMVVEEPDIEIGAGVSSKAMSRRIATDTGGRHGPKSSRPSRRDEQNDDRPGSRSNFGGNMGGSMGGANNSNPNNMPVMPFPFPGMANGMPMFPPNFFQNFPQQGGNNNQ
ncbi:uncharacterized protein HMPREF1541_08640 [Cyphellophora europaea CBS 101466]|uniref:CID domain-containing protein n=1 Tax=Cyphellophora europaea (strain CBS 101466) TaxID=1220924 RepID=W2RKZ6_CYPE1|nr:uncharacterized protein HMPREF1541_08640 [Cyphellophora europaea CBS 101466]ETN36363.1 hypothetical protein HMPREF1541_08640 [Cyphellophora europaea CBS 101466]